MKLDPKDIPSRPQSGLGDLNLIIGFLRSRRKKNFGHKSGQCKAGLAVLFFALLSVSLFCPAPALAGPKQKKPKVPAVPPEQLIIDCSECAAPIVGNAPPGMRYGTVTVYLKSLGTELSGFSVSLIRSSNGNSFKTKESDMDGAVTFYGVPVGEYLALLHRTGGRLRPNLTTTIGDVVVKFPAPVAPAESPAKTEEENGSKDEKSEKKKD